MEYITITTFKQKYPTINYNNYNDATMSGIISSASKKVDAYLGYSLEIEDITEKTAGTVLNGDIIIFPRKIPVNSMSSLSIVKGSSSISITSNYDIPASKDRVIYSASDMTMESVSVIDFNSLNTGNFFSLYSYNAGYSINDIPEDIVSATELYIMDTMKKSDNINYYTAVRQGGISFEYGTAGRMSHYVKEAQLLLNGYKRKSGF